MPVKLLALGFVMSMPRPQTYPLKIAGLERELPVVEVQAGVYVALFNLLGDPELTEAVAQSLVQLLPSGGEILITPEVKALPLTHALAVRTGLPYVVARKSVKPYMYAPVVREVVSITTAARQTLVLDGHDAARIKGRNSVIVDDVVSTGSTLEGLRGIIAQVGGNVIGVMAALTEGKPWPDVRALGHLPLL